MVQCLVCQKKFKVNPYRIHTAKYCSIQCRGSQMTKWTNGKRFPTGHIPWNKGLEGRRLWHNTSGFTKGFHGKHSIEAKAKMSQSRLTKKGTVTRLNKILRKRIRQLTPKYTLVKRRPTVKQKSILIRHRVRKTKEELLARKRFRNQRYKANKRAAIGTHTFSQWLALKAKYAYMCLWCKKIEPIIKLTEDHINPLSLGGTDSIDNIQPLCVSCNTKKNARFISFLPSKDLYLSS